MTTKVVEISLVILACLAIAAGLFYVYRVESKASAFRPHASEYLSVRDAAVVPSTSPLQGKAVVVNVDRGDIDTEIFTRLPDSIRAVTPGEVDFVILVGWIREETGQYSNGEPGFQHLCEVQIVEYRARTKRKQFTVIGSKPPQKLKESDTHADRNQGDRPLDEIVSRIASCFQQIAP